MKKTYTLIIEHDHRNTDSGWLTVTRYGHRVFNAVRFNNCHEFGLLLANTKSSLITQGATHFKTAIR